MTTCNAPDNILTCLGYLSYHAVYSVGFVNVSFAVHCHSDGIVKRGTGPCSISIARRCGSCEGGHVAGWRDDTHSFIDIISHIYQALRIHCDSSRVVKARAGAVAISDSGRPTARQSSHHSSGCNLTYAIRIVSYIHVSHRIYRESRRIENGCCCGCSICI